MQIDLNFIEQQQQELNRKAADLDKRERILNSLDSSNFLYKILHYIVAACILT